jgi:hypothetical protein
MNENICDMNGKLVEHSSLILDMTGSRDNVAILERSEQGKAAAFYLGSYFSKEQSNESSTPALLVKIGSCN